MYDNEKESQIKGMYAGQPQCGAQTANVTDEPCKPGLFERVRMQARSAERETHRAMRLAELSHLLEKNPEVARILDLMETVR
jgi:biotin synthase-related radical SAM superfamily protein